MENENVLLKYFTERHKELSEGRSTQNGPVITVSREFGCPAKEFTLELTNQLNKIGPLWRVISKESMKEAAEEMKLNPRQVEYVFKDEKRDIMDEMLNAMTYHYYKNDKYVRNAMSRILRQIARQGYVIILGRCGVCITQDVEKSLHIMLEAPEDFRLKNVMEWFELDEKNAREKMQEMDRKRIAVRDEFAGGRFDYHQFDLRVNMSRYTVKQAVDLTVSTIKMWQLI